LLKERTQAMNNKNYYIFYIIMLYIVWVRSYSKMLPYTGSAVKVQGQEVKDQGHNVT